ncbi:MAG: ribosomal protein S12 methylthiotransferase [Flavobacteriales bacterium]|jgi:ribosomal protein S12 methylthiotransferase
MKTKGLKRPKINVVTLGCSKNIYDSEVLMAQLNANQYEVTHESTEDDAPIVIINTCGFIDNAKEESVNTILRYAEAKREGQVEKVYVTGCLSERYADDLKKEIPEVDSWYGTRELPRLLKTLKADYKKELVGERLLTTPVHYAYLKIAEGCDRPCAFCAIPLMRGKHVSTPMEDLVAQTKSLAAKGTKELILIAQDLTFYGLDIYKERRLAALITALSEVEGIEWIRLHYAYPSGFPEDVLDVIRENPKVCNYLDIPLQHGTTKMLKSMRRGITREKTDELLEKIRAKVPGICIRTTLISGFPGETQEDFEEMKSWVSNQKFNRLGIFNYSHEEDTHAYLLEDDVPAEVKAERAQAIMDVQEEISYQHNQKLVGETIKVLVDRVEGDYYVARSEFDSPEVDNEVLISTEHFLRVGDFVNVKIDSADSFDLEATPVD